MHRAGLRLKSDSAPILPFGKPVYREQAVAIFRLAVSLIFVSTFPLIRPLVGHHTLLVSGLLFGYAVVSLLVLARVFLTRSPGAPFLIAVHVADMLWPTAICLFTGCNRSPFVLLFIFALLTAPYRRKSLETVLIALVSVLIVLCETIVATLPAFARWDLTRGSLELGPFTVRAATLLVVGGFQAYSAYWAEKEQQAYATRSVMRRLHASAGVEANLRELLPAILEVFEARRIVLVLRNSSTWRLFQWGAGQGREEIPQRREVSVAANAEYFWPMPDGSWSLACSQRRNACDCVALNREGWRVPADEQELQRSLQWEHPFRNLLVTNLQFGNEWTGRLFLVDPPCRSGRESALHLLQQMVEEVGPAAYNFYRWQHTSARVRAIERQKLARDLHDGVIQSLIATEMQLELVRRKSAVQAGRRSLPETLQSAQNVLRDEVRRLREHIELLRSSTPRRPLVPSLAEMLDHFERATGIVTRFAFDVHEETVPSRVSMEIVHIVEEALSNVRKHSGARNVNVRLKASQDGWEVVVQDDGRGFDFSGCLSLAELEAEQKGPRIIRERVQAARGQLTLESYPNRGARLKVRLAAH